jgi:dTDP-4-amino-4,6-dideoxygalactose transaminase
MPGNETDQTAVARASIHCEENPAGILATKRETPTDDRAAAARSRITMIASENPTSVFPLAAGPGSAEAVVPFNALETTNWDLCKAFGWIFQPDSLEALRVSLQQWSHEENVVLAPSGECAIAQILSLLPQEEVVMPAWICHQVKTAVKVAGKRIIFVDLGKNSINATSAEYNAAAKPGRILLIAHLFGVPTDVEAICELARQRDCLTIEDAVPAIGGRQDGRLLGTFADFGVFSFEQSKRLPAFRGGFIVANNGRLCDLAKLANNRLAETTRSMPYVPLAKAFLQNLFTNPWIYRQVTRRLLPLRPAIGRILTARPRQHSSPGPIQEATGPQAAPRTPFYTKEIHPYQAQLALRMIRRIDNIGAKISELAAVYEKHFQGTRIQTFLPAHSDRSGLMRFPIAYPGRDRSEILRRARQRGIYLKVLWSEEADCEGLPNSLWAARNLILLPLYTALSPSAAGRIAETLLDIERTVAAG